MCGWLRPLCYCHLPVCDILVETSSKIAAVTDPLLEIRRLTRTFPGVRALIDASLTLQRGEVHGLVGENGAGKSTLINVLSGVLAADSGTIALEGTFCDFANPVEARQAGISTVHQEAELFPTLSIAENMALQTGLPRTARGLVDRDEINRRAAESLKSLGESIEPSRLAATLSVAQRQMCQVAAAVQQQSKIVILDEPTSALSESEAEWLFAQIERLKKRGAAVLYVSHRLEEIFRLTDRLTVLRDGERVWSGETREVNQPKLVELMVGRETETPERPSDRVAEGDVPVPGSGTAQAVRPEHDASVSRLRTRGLSHKAGRFSDVSLDVARGEVLGIYGLVGAGRSELARTVFGLDRAEAGSIEVDGKAVSIRRPRDAVRAGLAFVPEDRLREGVCRSLSSRANAVLASLARWAAGPFVIPAREKAAALSQIEKLDVRCHSDRQTICQLSGGNQQKLVLGRWLLTTPKVLILDEPTRGVDIRSKREIHSLLRDLAGEGCSVILISSELPEVLENSDRVLVFRQGRISGEFNPAESSAREIAGAAFPVESFPTQDPSPLPPEERVPEARVREPQNKPATSPRTSLLRRAQTETALAVIVALLAGWLAKTSDGFSFASLLTNASVWSLLGLAAATVILAGGIDISIGALVGMSAVSASLVLKTGLPPAVSIPLACLTGVAVGTAGGLANAAVSLAGRVHPIVVTLGTMTIYRGLVIMLCGGKSVGDLLPIFSRLAIDPASGFRGVIPLAAIVLVAGFVWLRHTRSGRHLYAFGSSPTASRQAGISHRQSWLTAFGVGGFLAGLAGVVQLAISGQMQANLGTGWELQAITIAVIGGVAITGGRGTVVGVALGALLLRLVNSALVRWGIAEQQVDLAVGAMLLTAILFDLVWRRRSE